MAESSRFRVVTEHAGVHYLGCGGALPLGVWCHRHFSPKTGASWACHRHGDGGALPYFSRDYGFGDLARMVTTPRVVPPPSHVR
jgi:hypothetical protein